MRLFNSGVNPVVDPARLAITGALVVSIMIAAPAAIAATGHGGAVDEVHVDTTDIPSMQRGARLFVNFCLSCHSASYMRYERISTDLDIPLEVLREELMFTTDRVGDLMITTMPEDDARRWFGVAPPDLTLISRLRKPEWIYTYLRAFYQDENSPSGWNNSLFENVAMPHVMYELQGAQTLVGMVDHSEETDGDHEGGVDAQGHRIIGDGIFELTHPGSMSPDEFDAAMLDLTNYLAYMAEPAQLKRKTIGVYTIGFLIIFLIVAYLLKKEYWRDIH
jgi:ubiquinol-cytochrome c reductase cytochrome c1 subunit